MDKDVLAGKILTVPMLIGVVVVYLVIIQGATHFLTSGVGYEYAKFPTTESIVRGMMIPVGLSVVFVALVVSWLGWWNRIWYERIRLAGWAWVVPIITLLSILTVTNYSRLIEVGPIMVLALLGTALLIGIGEELMFRGIALETLRSISGSTELKAALWMTLIFGAAHATNVFTEGGAAFVQVAVAGVSGLLSYVVLRVSGTLLVPIILHAGWDFSLFSGDMGIDPEPRTVVVVAFLTNILLGAIVIVRRRAIWPVDKPGSEDTGTTGSNL